MTGGETPAAKHFNTIYQVKGSNFMEISCRPNDVVKENPFQDLCEQSCREISCKQEYNMPQRKEQEEDGGNNDKNPIAKKGYIFKKTVKKLGMVFVDP